MTVEHLEQEQLSIAWVMLAMRKAGNTESPKFAELVERYNLIGELIEAKGGSRD